MANLTEKLPSKDDLPDPLCHLKDALNNWTGYGTVETLELKETNEETVKKLINSMKNSASFGHDCMDANPLN